jgi:hypothetical protein
MPNSNQLFRLINEMVFMLAGALLLWVGLVMRFGTIGRFAALFDARQPTWLVVTAVLILWGLRTWRKAPRFAIHKDRLAMRIGGGSLMLAGAILLALAWMPVALTGILLAIAGTIFVVRGLITAAIMARSS